MKKISCMEIILQGGAFEIGGRESECHVDPHKHYKHVAPRLPTVCEKKVL